MVDNKVTHEEAKKAFLALIACCESFGIPEQINGLAGCYVGFKKTGVFTDEDVEAAIFSFKNKHNVNIDMDVMMMLLNVG